MNINPEQIILLQRIFGILAFSLLVIQIISGAFKKKMFHHFLSIAILFLIVLHPLLYVLFLFKIKGVLDPFYVFSDLCLLCKGNFEYFYNFGRIALWLIVFSIFVMLFKNSSQFLKKYAGKLHRLNYLAFYLVALHAKFLGTDVSVSPFKWVYWGGIVLVTATLIIKLKRVN